MKNIKNERTVKCLVVSGQDLQKIIVESCGENVTVDNVSGSLYFDPQYQRVHYTFEYFYNIINEHYGIEIKKAHCVTGKRFSEFDVWLEYEEPEEVIECKQNYDGIKIEHACELLDILNDFEDSNIKVLYQQKLHDINNVYVEYETLCLRPISLMTKEDKIECDISYADEAEIWDTSDVVCQLNDIENYYSLDELSLSIDIKNEEYDCSWYYDEKNDTIILVVIDEI